MNTDTEDKILNTLKDLKGQTRAVEILLEQLEVEDPDENKPKPLLKGSADKMRRLRSERDVFNKFLRMLQLRDDSYDYIDLLFSEYRLFYGVSITTEAKKSSLDPLEYAERAGLIPRLFMLAYQLFDD